MRRLVSLMMKLLMLLMMTWSRHWFPLWATAILMQESQSSRRVLKVLRL
jgi:hypothetical protein